jgi:small acid-soluble spore protein (thioredoxin-like protein)
MSTKGSPPDRTHNVRTTKTNIDRTNQNMEFADEMIAETSDAKLKKELTEKNKRREQALDGFQQEVRDDAKHHKP